MGNFISNQNQINNNEVSTTIPYLQKMEDQARAIRNFRS